MRFTAVVLLPGLSSLAMPRVASAVVQAFHVSVSHLLQTALCKLRFASRVQYVSLQLHSAPARRVAVQMCVFAVEQYSNMLIDQPQQSTSRMRRETL